jgi:uncharacterized protein (TIGR03083 family)
MASISEFLHGLDEGSFDHPSLCEGWRVRDVVSHMCIGYTTPMTTSLAKLIASGLKVHKVSRDESIAFGSSHTPAEILAVFDRIFTENIRMGITRVLKPAEGLVDHLIHHQDIRRPLGMPREIPQERLVPALGLLPRLGGLIGTRRRVAGLHLVATDVDFECGAGPVVRGPGEALLLAGGGRPVGLELLEGEGVDLLASRL